MRVALRCTKFNREANSVEINVLKLPDRLVVVVVVLDLKEIGILINLNSEIFLPERANYNRGGKRCKD